MRRMVLGVCLLLGSYLQAGFTPERWFDKPRSPRIANYEIKVVLDWPKKSIEGHEVISWRNTGTVPTSELPLHLALNAFKNPQAQYQKGNTSTPQDSQDFWGYCLVTGAEMDGRKLEHHSGEDETVHWVKLARAVAPGETVKVQISWNARFPRLTGRTGWVGTWLLGGDWHPKVGVFVGDRWVCQPAIRGTGLFADYGVYDVEFSLPNLLTLVGTGLPVPIPFKDTNGSTQLRDARPDPKRPLNFIWRVRAEDVNDFGWVATPNSGFSFDKRTQRGVDVFYFQPPQNGTTLPRIRDAVGGGLKLAQEWCVPFPYPVLTVMEVPAEAAAAAGASFPTFILTRSVPFDPLQWRARPEEVTLQAFARQYFQSLLAGNELQEPWLHAGLSTWFAHKAMGRLHQTMLPSRRFHWATDQLAWEAYWRAPQTDPLIRAGHMAYPGSLAAVATAKPTLVLDHLEAQIGRPVMEEALRVYARDFQFKHPTAKDFRKVLEKVSGRDLTSFWRDYVEGTEVLDYAIAEVNAVPVLQGGWRETSEGARFAPLVSTGARGTVTLVRRGGIRTPITLWVRLEDRREQRVTWDGEDRWTTFQFDAPVASALLDPDQNLPLLRDRLHASYSAKPARRGFQHWAQFVWGGVTGLLQAIGLG